MCENIHFLKIHFFYILCRSVATPLFYSHSMAQTESWSVPVSLNFLFCPQFAADLAVVGFSSWDSPDRRRNYVGKGKQQKANSEADFNQKAKMFQSFKSRYLEAFLNHMFNSWFRTRLFVPFNLQVYMRLKWYIVYPKSYNLQHALDGA